MSMQFYRHENLKRKCLPEALVRTREHGFVMVPPEPTSLPGAPLKVDRKNVTFLE